MPPDGPAVGPTAADLKPLRAELASQLEQLDFRFHNIGPALAEMARSVERTIRRLARDDGSIR